MASGEQQRAELRKLANELRVEAYILTEDDSCILEALQAAYSLGWDTMKEQAAKVAEGSIRGWEFKRGIGKCKLAEAIRAIPRPDILHSSDRS